MGQRFWAPLRPEPGLAASMPQPDLLVIDERPDGTFLWRYTASGGFAGDTWHPSVDEAREQAAFEFGADLTWSPIPETESDPIAFAIDARFKLTPTDPTDRFS